MRNAKQRNHLNLAIATSQYYYCYCSERASSDWARTCMQPKVTNSDEPLDTHSWHTECKTATGQSLVVWDKKPSFRCANRLYAKLDCPVARQKFSLLATAHDCETGLLAISELPLPSVSKRVLMHFLWTCKWTKIYLLYWNWIGSIIIDQVLVHMFIYFCPICSKLCGITCWITTRKTRLWLKVSVLSFVSFWKAWVQFTHMTSVFLRVCCLQPRQNLLR